MHDDLFAYFFHSGTLEYHGILPIRSVALLS